MNKLELIKNAFPKTEFEEFSVKKTSTGGYLATVTTNTGTTLIRETTKSGVIKDSIITIPYYETKIERDQIILDLLQNHLQEEVADFLGISQATVSNVSRKK